MEAEVFLLGHWKDYEELESSLSMSELIATLGAMHEKENRQNKFLAAIQGIDLSDQQTTNTDSEATTIEEVYARANKRLTGDVVASEALAQGINESEGTSYDMIGVNQ